MGARVITTVVEAAEDYDLVDLLELKEDLQLTGDADDGYLDRLITRASAAVANYCNRVFAVETVSDQFLAPRDPSARMVSRGLERLQLTRFPAVAVTSVVLCGTALVAGTDFLVDKPLGQLVRLDASGGQVGWPPGGVVVTYSAGFDPIPFDVQDAVTRLIKGRLASRTRDPLLRSESIPGVASNTYWIGASSDTGNLPPDVADGLDSYRIRVFA